MTNQPAPIIPASAEQTCRRWMSVGRSSCPDSRVAGRDAVRDALTGDDPKLVIVFCSDSHDLADLLAGAAESRHRTPLVGCSTAGEIATSGPSVSGVVAVGLGGPGFTVATTVAREAATDLRAAGATAADSIHQVEARRHTLLLLLSDGLAGDQQEVVRGAYAITGATIPMVGGCAGDDLKMIRTAQLADDEVLYDTVIGVALGSDSPMGIGVAHGWRKVGQPMMVTQSSGNRVLRLNDRPALDVYLEALAPPDPARGDPAAFTAFAMTHPLGLSRRNGEEVRFVGGADFVERSLICIATVPQGGMTWTMEGDDDSVLGATDTACAEALTMLHGRSPIGLLAFDCIARKGVLGDEGVNREVARIGSHTDGAPVAGFYTYGEFARTRGVTGFHNQTLVVLALS